MLSLPPPNAEPPAAVMVINASQARAAAWQHLQKGNPTFRLDALKWGTEKADIHKGKNTVRVGVWHWPGGRTPPSRFMIWVDADGNIVETKNTTPHEGPMLPLLPGETAAGSEVVFAKTRYQGDKPITIAEHPGKPFALVGSVGTTYEAANSFPLPSTAFPVTSTSNIFGNSSSYEDRTNQLFSDNARTPAGEAQSGVESFNRFIYKFLNRWSYDGKGGKIDSLVHVGFEYNNAFYAGGPPEDPGWCQCLYYGDGSSHGAGDVGISFTNLTDYEVIGHEFAHAITAHTANLEYWSQSGGLNEATSDIFGKAFQFWVDAGYPSTIPTPVTLSKWTIGSKILRKNGIEHPLRFLYKPSLDAAIYNGEYKSFDVVEPGISDADVHFSSGPLNRWAYLASVGVGPVDTDTLGSKYLKEGLDYNTDFDSVVKVWYRALTTYLEPDSHYSDAAFAVDKAAIELFGEKSRQRAAFSAAMVAINAIPREMAHIWPTLLSVDARVVPSGTEINLSGGGFLNSTVLLDGVAIPTIYRTDDWIACSPTKSGNLSVSNLTGTSQKSIYVEVVGAPKIKNFEVSPGAFRLGESVTLSWEAEVQAGGVTLNGEPVVPIGTKTIALTDTTVFTLIAQNSAGVSSWTITAWYRPFDLNKDGVINIFDVLEVKSKVLTLGPTETDVNGNSKTDDEDVKLIWKALK